jgi:hypothetical protein
VAAQRGLIAEGMCEVLRGGLQASAEGQCAHRWQPFPPLRFLGAPGPTALVLDFMLLAGPDQPFTVMVTGSPSRRASAPGGRSVDGQDDDLIAVFQQGWRHSAHVGHRRSQAPLSHYIVYISVYQILLPFASRSAMY